MSSMDLSNAFKSVSQAALIASTNLWGVNVKVFTPLDLNDSGFQNYGDIRYSETPVFEGKLLVPELIEKYSVNSNTNLDYFEDKYTIWSPILFPRMSKIQVLEDQIITSGIINEVNKMSANRSTIIYYKYDIIPSSSFVKQIDLSDSEDFELDIVNANQGFLESINGEITLPTSTPSTSIKYNKL